MPNNGERASNPDAGLSTKGDDASAPLRMLMACRLYGCERHRENRRGPVSHEGVSCAAHSNINGDGSTMVMS